MERNELSTEERVLMEYLTHFLPGDEDDKNTILKSSLDIADDLSEMTELELKDIAKQLISLNYKVVLDDDHKPKWLMVAR